MAEQPLWRRHGTAPTASAGLRCQRQREQRRICCQRQHEHRVGSQRQREQRHLGLSERAYPGTPGQKPRLALDAGARVSSAHVEGNCSGAMDLATELLVHAGLGNHASVIIAGLGIENAEDFKIVQREDLDVLELRPVQWRKLCAFLESQRQEAERKPSEVEARISTELGASLASVSGDASHASMCTKPEESVRITDNTDDTVPFTTNALQNTSICTEGKGRESELSLDLGEDVFHLPAHTSYQPLDHQSVLASAASAR